MSSPNWHVIHKDHDGDTVAQFVQQNLNFTLNKGENGPHEVTYEASRGQDAVFAGFARPYVTDFELWRDDLLFMTGMHTSVQVSSNSEAIAIAGKSYLHYLERRIWPFDGSDPNLWRYLPGLVAPDFNDPPTGYSYAGTELEVSTVIRDMLDVIKIPANCLDFTYVVPGVGFTLDHWEVGLPDTESILSKIQTLSHNDPGEFDFWMDVNKVFRMAVPRRYDIDVWDDEDLAMHVFDSHLPDSGCVEVNFTNTGPQFTWLIGQGQAPLPASTKEYTPGSLQFRRIDGSESYGDVSSSTTVAALTRKSLLFGLNPIHEISIVVLPEKIRDFWTRFAPGKAIWVKADMDGWIVDSAQEIVSISCDVDLNGNETVTLALNQIYQSEGITLT